MNLFVKGPLVGAAVLMPCPSYSALPISPTASPPTCACSSTASYSSSWPASVPKDSPENTGSSRDHKSHAGESRDSTLAIQNASTMVPV